MPDSINDAMRVAASGMRSQATRMRVVSENLANANSTSESPGGDPYRRKTVSFQTVLDGETKANLVGVRRVGEDHKTPFNLVYDPSHPAADEKGYVKMPNVNTLVEMMDLKEAQRSYEANLSTLDQARSMASRTIDLLR